MSDSAKIPTTQSHKVFSRPLIFGPAPMLEGENAEAYDELLAQVSSAVKPSDIIEDIWIRDIVDLTWEIFRWRRVKAAVLAKAVQYALSNELEWGRRQRSKDYESSFPLIDFNPKPKPPSSECKLVKKWAAGDPAAIRNIERLMVLRKVSMDAVIARAHMDKIADLDRINHLIDGIEARRNSVLHEIDRRRSTFSQRLRGTIHNIEDTEFKTIEPNAISPEPTANKSVV